MNEGQQKAFQLAKQGFNLFITGSAGTGKSYLLRLIIEELLKHKTVAVTASTGTAAHIIGGITLHSWLSLGLAKEPTDVLISRIKRYSTCSENIRKTQVLVIDEISQVRGEFLDKINDCCQHVRRNNLPFGGIQVIICGDFAQLPPIMALDIERELDQSYLPEAISDKIPPIDYAFKSAVWGSMRLKTAYLREVVRQKGDPTFIRILNNLREGRVSDEDFQPLLACIGRKFSNPEGDNSRNIFPTRLVPTNAEATRINQAFYSNLEGEEHIYHANFTVKRRKRQNRNKETEDQIVERMLHYTKTHGTLDPELRLKVGTRVILTQNINVKLGLFNGSQAIVERFIRLVDLVEEGVQLGIPDKKSQPSSSEGCYETERIANSRSSSKHVPVIRLVDKETLYALVPNTTDVRSDFNEEPNIVVQTTQYPLRHAWGLTIHKSQGMTLERATINAGRFIFSPGQTYTALSRVRSLDGLSLVDFEPNKVIVDPSVTEFYRVLAEQ